MNSLKPLLVPCLLTSHRFKEVVGELPCRSEGPEQLFGKALGIGAVGNYLPQGCTLSPALLCPAAPAPAIDSEAQS